MTASSHLLFAVITPPDAVREFSFAHPELLFLLLLVPLLLLLRRRSGSATCVIHPSIRFAAGELSRPATLAGRLGPILMSLAAACLIVALAQPRWLNHFEEKTVKCIDIMVACDLSGSMGEEDMLITAQDSYGRRIRRTVDRLTAAKFVINNFIDGRPHDRIGLVAFAGKAKSCSPLTLDHTLVRYILEHFYLGDEYRHGYIREQGTAIGTAIVSAALRLRDPEDVGEKGDQGLPENERAKSKVIILVTDGVSNMGSISPQDAAREAAKLGIKIFPIGIGQDRRLSQYTANINSIDEESLKEIAAITGGQYYRASSGNELMKAFSDIDRLEKSDIKQRAVTTVRELFYWPLALGCLLLALSILLRSLRPAPAP